MIIRAMVAWVLSAGVTFAQATSEEIVFANAEFTVWHQAARAITAQNGFVPAMDDRRPIFYALHRVTLGEDALDVERLQPIAEMWLAAEEAGRVPDYFQAARLDGEFARRLLCYLAGEGPGPAHAAMSRWGPPRSPASCEADVAMELDDAAAFYDAYLDVPNGPIDTDAEGDELAADALALVASAIAAGSGVPDGLQFRLSDCGIAQADYADDTQTVTLCAELMHAYRSLADRLAE